MDTPVDLTFRNTAPRPEIEALVRRETANLRYGRWLVSSRRSDDSMGERAARNTQT